MGQAVTGSPLHTWGIPNVNGEREADFRITPTYVGNTHDGVDFSGGVGDHPYIRGEYTKQIPLNQRFKN